MSLTRLALLLCLSSLFAITDRPNQPPEPSSSGGSLLVANKAEHTLGIVDPASGKQLAAVDEDGITGHEVASSPDGRLAFVPIYGNSGVGRPGTDGSKLVVVDIAARRIAGTVDFGHGVRPHCAVVDPRSRLLYVTTEIDNSVSVIDLRNLKIVGSVPTGQAESHMLAVTRNGERGYTANVGPGTVSVLDLKARKIITVLKVAPVVQRIALSVDDRLVFTSDQTKPQLAVIDTATNKLKSWLALPEIGYGAAATPDGRWLLIALPRANKVAAIDLGAMKVARTLDVPATPQEVIVRPDGGVAYVSCDASAKVAEINISAWKVERLIDAGKGADGLAWAPQK
jgi:DNA-binding beta-propeller fold protein YncE